MKSIPSAVSAQMQLQQKRPALLFELGLSGNTLYYIAEKDDLVYANITYTAKAITISEFAQSAEGQINRITVNFDNTSRDMSAYATYAQFEGRPFIVKRVYKDALSGTTLYNEVFRGTMEELTNIGRTWLPISAVAGKPLHQKALLKEYSRNCRYVFGDSMCNVGGLSDLTSASNYAKGTILTGATNYMVINTDLGSVTGTNDDAFNYGVIKIGKGGTTYVRTCSNWTSATSRADWIVALPVTLDNTYHYEIYKNCPKDLNSCTAAYAWGPIANNGINFGGFIHIGKEKYGGARLSTGAEQPQHWYPPPSYGSDSGDDGGWNAPDRDDGAYGGENHVPGGGITNDGAYGGEGENVGGGGSGNDNPSS